MLKGEAGIDNLKHPLPTVPILPTSNGNASPYATSQVIGMMYLKGGDSGNPWFSGAFLALNQTLSASADLKCKAAKKL